MAQRVVQLISDTQEIQIEKISLDAPFDEIGLTSLNALSIVFEIENEFGVTIRDEDALLITNVRQVVESLRVLLDEQTARLPAALQS